MSEERPGYLAQLQAKTHDELVNEIYNDRVAELADFEEKAKPFDDTTTGKRIPYLGWFWRHTDFVGKRISIGDSGSYVGVMESNKWGYPERLMTEDEATTFIRFLDTAFAQRARLNDAGAGKQEAEQTFAELRRWFQSLDI